MERKPEVWPRKHRVYFYRDPVIQLRITGLFHSTKNDINFSFSANCRSGQYKEDYVVSLPDEVVEALMEFRRGDTAYRIRTYRYKAYISLDCGDNIERKMRHHAPSVQEIIEQHMEEEKLYVPHRIIRGEKRRIRFPVCDRLTW